MRSGCVAWPSKETWSAGQLFLIAATTRSGQGERHRRDVLVPGHEVAAERTAHGFAMPPERRHVEPQISFRIAVEAFQRLAKLRVHAVRVVALPMDPGARVQNERLIEGAPRFPPEILESFVAVPIAAVVVELEKRT